MQVDLPRSSWLNLTSLYVYQGVTFWGQTEYPEIPYSDQDFYLNITQDQASRMDLVAYDYYGDSGYIWVLLLANQVDLPNQFVANQRIRIPDLQTIQDLLSQSTIS